MGKPFIVRLISLKKGELFLSTVFSGLTRTAGVRHTRRGCEGYRGTIILGLSFPMSFSGLTRESTLIN